MGLLEGTLVASAASMSATLCTNPLDVVKVRMQLQGAAGVGGGEAVRQRSGVLQSAMRIVRAEGIGTLWRGTSMALLRAGSYGGLRLGSYHPIKEMLHGEVKGCGEPSVGIKALAGILAGTAAAGVCSPLELLKTRLQAHPDHGHAASGASGTFRQLVAERGVGALWAGAQPSMLRGGLLTATQCACYEECKAFVVWTLPVIPDGWPTYLAAAMVTGLVSTTVTNPADVLKTYRYMRPGVPLLACLLELARHEGAGALLKGWTANYARVGPHTVLILVFNEQIRRVTGLDAF